MGVSRSTDESPTVLRVGLTGGIAAGKSTVAARLRRLGAVLVDHDVLARAVVAPGSDGLAAVVTAFGEGVVTALGTLDRRALGEVVFSDPAARERLNAIVHPLVRGAAHAEEASAVAERAGSDGTVVVVHDIPLLVETGQAGHFDEVVVVDAPPELRVARLVEGRGMGRTEAWSRVAAQAADDERLAAATVVLDGSGSVADLEAQVDRVWRGWQARVVRPEGGA